MIIANIYYIKGSFKDRKIFKGETDLIEPNIYTSNIDPKTQKRCLVTWFRMLLSRGPKIF